GYRMGSYKVYNPWSVVNACYDMILEPGAELERHWANTASNSLVRDILRQDGFKRWLQLRIWLMEAQSIQMRLLWQHTQI
ncbi:MAG: hypothetical protein FWG30_08265, partial [Eubacteriaceae bacterium]|nr:hypothetical protein [Eubacteriaceae bacterium]